MVVRSLGGQVLAVSRLHLRLSIHHLFVSCFLLGCVKFLLLLSTLLLLHTTLRCFTCRGSGSLGFGQCSFCLCLLSLSTFEILLGLSLLGLLLGSGCCLSLLLRCRCGRGCRRRVLLRLVRRRLRLLGCKLSLSCATLAHFEEVHLLKRGNCLI